MDITYKLNKNIVNRIAANLVFKIQLAKNDIHFIKDEVSFNGKSFIGILNNNLKENDILKIKIDNINDLDVVKEAFENIGEAI